MPKNPPENRLNPRRTPLQRRSAHTVDAVLEAAARILETEGLAACTTNAVAARAGVSIGSLYQYFPNRDAITVALIERETATLLADIANAAGSDTFDAFLGAVVRAAVAHQMRRPALARVVDFEERRLPVGERNERVTTIIHTALTEALVSRRDAPPCADVPCAAQDVLALVRGMIDMAGERGETDAASLEARVLRAVAGYLGGAA